MHLTTRTELGDLAGAWDDLAGRQPLPSPFLRSWWIEEVPTGSLVVLTFHRGTTLVGGAAFEVDRLGRGRASVERVRCVGQGTLAPDHLDVIAEPGEGGAVAEAVVQWLRRPGSRVIDLDGLAADGLLGRALAPHITDRTAAPWTPLTKDYAAYLGDRPGQLRSTLKRRGKQLAAAGAELRRVPDADVATALAALADLHDPRWSDESGFLDSWDRFNAAAQVGAARGEVVIHELRTADEVIATELDLVSDDRLAFYQAGRRTDHEWRAAGSVLKAHIIEWACGAGFGEFDLLRGDESYKADWADQRRDVARVRFGTGPAGVGVHAAGRGWRWMAPRVADARQRLADRRHADDTRDDATTSPTA